MVTLENRKLVIAVFAKTLDFPSRSMADGALAPFCPHRGGFEHAQLPRSCRSCPRGRRSEVSRTSEAFSPKMGAAGVSPPESIGLFALRRHLADQKKMSPPASNLGNDRHGFPASSRLRRASSPTLGISAVDLFRAKLGIAWPMKPRTSSIWIEVKTSSRAMRSEMRMESSKL